MCWALLRHFTKAQFSLIGCSVISAFVSPSYSAESWDSRATWPLSSLHPHFWACFLFGLIVTMPATFFPGTWLPITYRCPVFGQACHFFVDHPVGMGPCHGLWFHPCVACSVLVSCYIHMASKAILYDLCLPFCDQWQKREKHTVCVYVHGK